MNQTDAVPGLQAFNTAPAEMLRPRLLTLTASAAWADGLLDQRPYDGREALLHTSDELVTGLPESEVDAALAGHPRIGERAAGLDDDSAQRSAREQAGMSAAGDDTRRAMDDGNRAYEERFGRIYLVAAAGRSAEDLLALLRQRLGNDPDAELTVVRTELAKITRLRMTDLIDGGMP